MREVSFRVDLPAIGAPRARASGKRRFHPQEYVDWQMGVAHVAKAAMAGAPMIDAPCRVDIYAIKSMPTSWTAKKRNARAGKLHDQKPDWDNVAKAVCDALSGIVFTDDKLVGAGSVEVRWGEVDRFSVSVRAEP